MNDMILYVKNPKDATKELKTNKCSKVPGWKITRKSVYNFYTLNNEQSDNEIKKTINNSIYSGLKKNKIPRAINLTKEGIGLYTGNYRTLLQEIKDKRHPMFMGWKTQYC